MDLTRPLLIALGSLLIRLPARRSGRTLLKTGNPDKVPYRDDRVTDTPLCHPAPLELESFNAKCLSKTAFTLSRLRI